MIQTPAIEISDDEARIVLDILEARIPHRDVWVFGSRAQNRAGRRSDLDLAVGGSEPLPIDLSIDLKEDFLESDLPYFVDVIDLTTVTPEFRSCIESDFLPVALLHDQLNGDAPTDRLSEHEVLP